MIKKHIINTARDALWYGTATIFARVSLVLLLPFYARWFSPVEMGIAQGFIVFINLCYVIMAVQMISVTMRYYYEYESRGELHKLIGTLMLALMVIIAVVAILIISNAEWVSNYLFKSEAYSRVIIIGVLATMSWVLNDYVMVLLRLRRKPKSYTVICIMQFLAIMLLNGVLVWQFKMGLMGVFWATLVANVFVSVILVMTGNVPKRYGLSLTIAVRITKYMAPIVMIPLLEWVRNYFYQLYVLRNFGEAELGVISIAIRFIQVYILIETAIALAWQPTSMAVIGKPECKNLYRHYYRYLMAIYLLLFISLSLFAKEIIYVVATDKYILAFRYVPLLFLMPLGKALYSHYSLGITISEKTLYRAAASASGGAISVALIVVLGWLGGTYGVLLGSGLGSLSIALIALYFSNKHYRIGYSMRPLIVTLSCALLVIIYNVALSSAMISSVEVAFKFAVVGIMIVFLYYYWFANNERQYLRKLFGNMRNRLTPLMQGN